MRNGAGGLALLALFALCGAVGICHAAETTGRTITVTATERPVELVAFQAAGTAPRPAALLLHGGNGFKNRLPEYSRYAAALAGAGIDAYLVYYYSDKDVRDRESGVDNFYDRLPAWRKLVGDVAGEVLKREHASGKIGIVGFSNGAILGTAVSGVDPRIGAFVGYYGAVPGPLARDITRMPPTLLLHGDNDQVIPFSVGQELEKFSRALNRDTELVIYHGEGHGFATDANNVGRHALSRTIAFLKQRLADKPE